MNFFSRLFHSIVAIITAVRMPSRYRNNSSGGTSAVTESMISNSTNTSAWMYPVRNVTGRELYFFAHGDWGKSGYWDNDVNGRRQLERNLKEEGEGDHEHEEDEHEHEEDEHEHEEDEHDDRKEEVFWQGQVARSMLAVANLTHPSFVLALGDNFYADGVVSVNDSLWNSHFRDVYFRNTSALTGVPWHPTIGNHDLGYGDQGVQAQVDRTTASTSDDDGVWQMPGTNYTVTYNIPGGGFVQIVVVDTTWLAPSENDATDEASSSEKLIRLKRQLSHLYDIFQVTLIHPRPTWLVVAGHYPVYSAADKEDNDELVEYLVPFMEHYGVHCYLSGHDHINEHFTSDGIEYYVAGASSMTNSLSDDKQSEATLNWAGEDVAAFTRLTATTEELIVDYIDVNQTVIYRYTQTNANPTPSAAPTQVPTGSPSMAPSPQPTTAAPTVEVTYSFCDMNPDLCTYYMSKYSVNLNEVVNVTATMHALNSHYSSVSNLTVIRNSTTSANSSDAEAGPNGGGDHGHARPMVVVVVITTVALACLMFLALVWRWSGTKSAYVGLGAGADKPVF